MSSASRLPIRTSTTGLALASVAILTLGSIVLAAPPEPAASVTGACANAGQPSTYSQAVSLTIDAGYKGRWVDYEVVVSISDGVVDSKTRTLEKQDSTVPFEVTYTFATGDSLAGLASAQVQVLDRGVPVGEPGTWSDSCS